MQSCNYFQGERIIKINYAMNTSRNITIYDQLMNFNALEGDEKGSLLRYLIQISPASKNNCTYDTLMPSSLEDNMNRNKKVVLSISEIQ
jgi:hypothetical protein